MICILSQSARPFYTERIKAVTRRDNSVTFGRHNAEQFKWL